MIFETHAHYDDESFNDDREALIRSLPEKGIGRIINVGASIETTKTTLELAAKYDYIYAAVGVHPSDISGLNEETFAWLKEQASYTPVNIPFGVFSQINTCIMSCSCLEKNIQGNKSFTFIYDSGSGSVDKPVSNRLNC